MLSLYTSLWRFVRVLWRALGVLRSASKGCSFLEFTWLAPLLCTNAWMVERKRLGRLWTSAPNTTLVMSQVGLWLRWRTLMLSTWHSRRVVGPSQGFGCRVLGGRWAVAAQLVLITSVCLPEPLLQ